MSNKITRVLAPILVLGASFGAYALLQATKPEPEKIEDRARPISVYTTEVSVSKTRLRVTTQGDVRARTEIDMVSQVSGRIVEVSSEFTEGGRITPGTPLLKIEDTDYHLALSQTEARVAEAEVGVEQALADADVARKQLRNTSNPSDLALKKPQVAQARARLKAAEADLEQAQLNLRRTEVSLPFHGRLVNTRVDIGQYITPGTPIGRVFGTEVVEIRLPLNDSQLATLGLPIGFTAAPGEGLPVALSANVAGRLQQWQGKLVRLDASIDPNTRLLYAMAVVEDPYGVNVSASGMPLAVGLFVDATIEGRELERAISIPARALRAGNKAFLIDGDGLLDIRDIEIAQANEAEIVVTAGLEAGDIVVTSAIRNPIPGIPLTSISTADSKD